MKEFAFKYMEMVQHGLDHLNLDDLTQACEMIRACRGTVWLIGNGGSATLASHMATDLQLAGVRAQALTDVAAVTTIANDQHFQEAFSLQLRRLAREGDILIALSGSGNSANILTACDTAKKLGVVVIGMSGFKGGVMKELEVCTLHIEVAAQHMGVAQDLEEVALHIICYYLMEGRK